MGDDQFEYEHERELEESDLVSKRIESQLEMTSREMGYYIAEYTLEYYANKLKQDELVIPRYQREYVWREARASRLIESFLLNIPVPYVFLSIDNETGVLEIVDGSQRLRAVSKYFDNELTLIQTDLVPALEGTTFNDLKLSRKRKLLNTTLRAVVLKDSTDSSRAELFNRINTGSLTASPADIRRGSSDGPFQRLVEDLAEHHEVFRELAPLSENEEASRKGDELVARFFAFQGNLDNYKDRVADYIADYTKGKDENPSDLDIMKVRFDETMQFVKDYFPYGFRRNERGKATPNTRFDAIAIGVRNALDLNPYLKPDRQAVKEFITSEPFLQSIRADGANAKAKLIGRIDIVKDFLLNSEGKNL